MLVANKQKIVIIGAGACGLVAALLAKQCNLEVCIVEKNTSEHYHGHAHFLNATGLDILATVGVSIADLAKYATPMPQASTMIYGLDLQHTLAKLNLWDDGSYREAFMHTGRWGLSMNVDYTILRAKLLELIESTDIELLWEHELQALDLQAQQACIQTPSQFIKLDWDYLLACDGANSTLANLLGVDHLLDQHLKTFLCCDLNVDISPYARDKALLYWLYNPEIRCCVVAHDLSRHIVLQIPLANQYESIDDYPDQRIKNCLQAICGEGSEKLTAEVRHKRIWKMRSRLLATMQQERVFILGDAAHSMTPAGGLGLNTAIADAYNLIWKIASGNTPLLNSYTQERLDVARQACENSIANYEDFLSVPKALGVPMQLADLPAAIDYYTKDFLPQPLHRKLSKVAAQPLEWIYHYSQMDHQLAQQTRSRVQAALAGNALHFSGVEQHRPAIYRSVAIDTDAMNYDDRQKESPRLGQKLLYTHYSSAMVAAAPIHSVYPNWLAIIAANNSPWLVTTAKLGIHTVEVDCLLTPKIQLLAHTHPIAKTSEDRADRKYVLAKDMLILLRPDMVVAFKRSHTSFNVRSLEDWMKKVGYTPTLDSQ